MSSTLLKCLGLGLTAAGVAGTTAAAMPVVAAVPILSAVGIGVAGGVLGNLSTEVWKVLDHRIAERFLDGWRSTDENHDIEAALRHAQLNALRTVLQRFNER